MLMMMMLMLVRMPVLMVMVTQVSDRAAGEQWIVLRRFRQFEELHRGLLPVLSREPDANAYALPPKEVRQLD